MVRFYFLFLLASLVFGLSQSASAQATAWRPFRPSLIYTYGVANSSSSNLHTLRVDSAYATPAGDSVYTFNRLMRFAAAAPGVPPRFYYRSRNNLFGARLRWRPGTSEYFLEANAEPNAPAPAAVVLRLLPRAAVGSTWTASAQPALTATLTSRTLSAGPLPDSVAVITLSNGAVVRLSRQLGLASGPQWLDVTGAGSTPAATWNAAYAPQTLAQSPYHPLGLFSLQPGDELGYVIEPLSLSGLPCSEGARLRRILTRQQTADSLVLTCQEQTRTVSFGAPWCGGGTGGTVITPVTHKRWAFSLRTGRSKQFPALPLLAGEYAPLAPTVHPLGFVMGLGITAPASVSACSSGAQLRYQNVYPNQPGTPAGQYGEGIDFLGWQQAFAAPNSAAPAQSGLGDVFTYDTRLAYARRTLPGGQSYVCGSAANFTGLLPTRTAQAAALATLHPNPATTSTTLAFAEPARAAATLYLTDALGRRVWQAPVAAGQTTVTLPLTGRPPGLYAVQLQLAKPDEAPTTWKLIIAD